MKHRMIEDQIERSIRTVLEREGVDWLALSIDQIAGIRSDIRRILLRALGPLPVNGSPVSAREGVDRAAKALASGPDAD